MSDETTPRSLSQLKDVKFISSGIAEIDELIGGYAIGRITELWGNPGVGKSHAIAKALAGLDGKKALYVDAEFALVKERLVALGVDTKKVDVVQDARLEMVADMIVDSIGKYDMIIIDSLAALTPMTIGASETGTNTIGLFARQVKHFVAKLKPKLALSKTAVVVINQARAGIGVMVKQKPQGGFAWEHGVDVRLRFSTKSSDKIDLKGRQGHRVTVSVDKSRLTPPRITAQFEVIYVES